MTQPSLDQPCTLLGGLSPQDFMRRHWQRHPLLIRQALPHWRSPLSPQALRRLARDPEVESRLVRSAADDWQLDFGPLPRLPRRDRPNWTVLVQGADLHDDAVAELRDAFRFVSDARLDDVMISLAGPGGGVGPHFDSYDVFLLQAHGRRRWQYGRQRKLTLREGLPLRILADFEPEHTVELGPGDMLYLPPHVAHDGVALDPDCMTYSIGFRAPTTPELVSVVLELALERLADTRAGRRYTDPGEPATHEPARLPDRLLGVAQEAVAQLRFEPELVADAMGRWLTEPKGSVVFDPPDQITDLATHWPHPGVLHLDRRSRLIYRGSQAWINGEPVDGKASAWLKSLADQRRLILPRRPPGQAVRRMLLEWLEAGWAHLDLTDAASNPDAKT